MPSRHTWGFAILIAAALAGRASAQPFNLEDQVQICATCHGEKGEPQEKTTPIIWGQHTGYLYLQLKDYKNGDRKNDLMNAVTADYERKDMLALAEYFSKLPWPRNSQKPASPEVALVAARANGSVGCTGCHQENYKGEGTQARLAGQTREYLLQTMLDIRTGDRGNNPGMTTLMKATSESDIAALAEYLAGLTLSQ